MVGFSLERGPALLNSQQQGRKEKDGEHMALETRAWMAKGNERRLECLWARIPAYRKCSSFNVSWSIGLDILLAQRW